MIPQIGQQVKCMFRNGFVSEGIVESWQTHNVQLRSLDGKSILIITNPAEDIMLIKIVLENPSNLEELPDISQAIDRTLANVSSQPTIAINPYDADYNKSLAELRKERAEVERRIITEKLKEHRSSIGGGKVKYEQPGFNKKPSIK